MASTSPFADLPPIKIGKGGGIGGLKAILGITPNSGLLSSLDVVIISIDLEFPGQDRRDMHKFKIRPYIEECGIAILDTRDLKDSSRSKSLNELITTREFSTKYPVKAKRLIPGRRCIFAQTNRIGQDQFRSVITKALQIKDPDSPPTGRHARLRNIVLVGHSVTDDLRIIQLLGVDIFSVAPVVAVVDTFRMALSVFGHNAT
jgi:hypothetical protein